MNEYTEADQAEELLAACERALGYQFLDRGLLQRCLTHASIAKTRLASNERLEFLGDAILGAVVSELLYHRFPKYPEGELTRIKSILVSRATCAEISMRLGLEEFLLLGKGLVLRDAVPMSIMAAVFESLVAGIYIDGGMGAARRFLRRILTPEIELATDSNHGRNFKSLLQQFAQKRFGQTPIYKLLDEKGPDHSKCFNVAAVIGTQVFTSAWGASKKEAEQQAAKFALDEMQASELANSAE